MWYSHCTEICIFLYFLEAIKPLFFDEKLFKILLYSFSSQNCTIYVRKTSVTQEWLVVESCPTPCWIAFLMLYGLVYNIRTYFNELILA